MKTGPRRSSRHSKNAGLRKDQLLHFAIRSVTRQSSRDGWVSRAHPGSPSCDKPPRRMNPTERISFTMSDSNATAAAFAARCRKTHTMDVTSHRKPTACNGGARRDRTDDLLLAKQALSQLSYGPIRRHPAHKNSYVVETRIASDRPCTGWWAWDDSNVRPHPYQGCALTT